MRIISHFSLAGRWGACPGAMRELRRAFLAVARSEEDILQALVPHFVDPNAIIYQWTMGRVTVRHASLLHVAMGAATGVREYLLSQKADVHAKDMLGRTPLHYAVAYGTDGVVKAMIEAGADVDVRDAGGFTPLMIAAHHGMTSRVNLLAPHAKVDVRDESGMTAMHWAALGGYASCVEVLIQNGASIDIRDLNGRSALHNGFFVENRGVVQMLLDRRAATDLEDVTGRTPPQLAGVRRL